MGTPVLESPRNESSSGADELLANILMELAETSRACEEHSRQSVLGLQPLVPNSTLASHPFYMHRHACLLAAA